MNRRVSRPLAWSLSATWAIAIFLVSSRPGNTLPGGYSVQAHLIEYAVLGGLLTWALVADPARGSAAGLAILLASLYGVTDEIHQHFVIMRTPDIADWVIDTVGAIAGAFATHAVLARRSRNTAGPGDPFA